MVWRTGLLGAVAVVMTGCSSLSEQTRVGVPESVSALTEQAVDQGPAVVEYRVDAGFARARRQSSSDPLPKTPVGPLSVSDVDAASLVTMLAEPLGLAVSADQEAATRTVRLSVPTKIGFDRAMRSIADVAGVSVSFRDGMIRLSSTESYYVPTSALPGIEKSITGSLPALGATDVHFDAATGGISYRADGRVALAVDQYLEKLRKQAAVVKYDAYIFEVSLTRDAAMGVKWDKLGALMGDVTLATTGGALASTSNLTAHIVSGSRVDLVASFLSKFGDVRALSNPRLSVVSGGETAISVGDVEYYVDRIGGTTTGSTVASTTSTKKLETGLKIGLKTTYTAGLVTTEVKISDSSLTQYQEFEVPGTTGTQSTLGSVVSAVTGGTTSGKLRLPKTSERAVASQSVSRPGDLVILAGLIKASETSSTDAIGGLIPTAQSDAGARKELVILLRPTVTVYVVE